MCIYVSNHDRVKQELARKKLAKEDRQYLHDYMLQWRARTLMLHARRAFVERDLVTLLPNDDC
jgi:hypothetical protein